MPSRRVAAAAGTPLRGPGVVRILGVDPGSRITGYGVIEKEGSALRFVACGVIKPNLALSFPARLGEIHAGMGEVIAEHRPEMAAVEEIFVSVNPRSALQLGHARGVILLAAVTGGLLIHEYTSRLVKQTVTGYGQAGKAQVQQMVAILLKLSASPSEDAADALAAAICCASHLDRAGVERREL